MEKFENVIVNGIEIPVAAIVKDVMGYDFIDREYLHNDKEDNSLIDISF